MMNSMTHMMKMHIRSFISIVSAVAVLGLTVQPASAAWPEARDRAGQAKEKIENRQAAIEERKTEMMEKREELQANRQEQFCVRFVEGMEAQQNRLTERYRNAVEKRSDRSGKTVEHRDSRDARLDENRAEQDAERMQWYEGLLAKADTDAERAAVAEFKAAMEKAVADRRTAVDVALETFRSEVDKLVAGKKSGTDTAATNFKTAYDKAIADAKSACEGDSPDSKAVRSAFMDAMKDARGDFQETRSGVAGIGEQVKALAATKNAAIKTAMESFKTTAQAARTKLVAAFGDTDMRE